MDKVARPEGQGDRVASNIPSKPSTKSGPSPSTADVDAQDTSGYETASALALEDDEDGYGEASNSPTGSTTQRSQQSIAGVDSTICPDLTHSADRPTPEESVDEDEDNADEYEDNADRDEWVQPITESTDERGKLVIGHRVGGISKIIDNGELVIGIRIGLIPKVTDELENRALCICKKK